MDETYLPLDERPAPQDKELQIRPGEICKGGPYQVCLANGRILLPQSMFRTMKTFIDGARH